MKRVLHPAGVLASTMRTLKACPLIPAGLLAAALVWPAPGQQIDVPKVDVPKPQVFPVQQSPVTLFPVHTDPVQIAPVAPTPVPQTPVTLFPIFSPGTQVNPAATAPVVRLPAPATPGLNSGGTVDPTPMAIVPAPSGSMRFGTNIPDTNTIAPPASTADTTLTNAPTSPLDSFLKFLHETNTSGVSATNAPATDTPASPDNTQPAPPPAKPSDSFIYPV